MAFQIYSNPVGGQYSEYTFNDELSKEVRNEVLKRASEEIQKESNKNSIDIKKAAKDYISQLNLIAEYYIKRGNKETRQPIYDMFINRDQPYESYKAAKEILIYGLRLQTLKEKIINAITIFQNSLNQFLGREILLTIVDDKGNIMFLNSYQEEELLQASSKNKVRLNLSSPKIKEFRNKLDKEDKQINIYNDFLQKTLKEYYTKIKQIYNITIERSTASSNNKYWFTYWHYNNERIYAYIKNKGVVKEGYVSALFDNNRIKENSPKDIHDHNDQSIKVFYDRYVTQATNRAGIVSGDITDDKNSVFSEVQFAVKGVGNGGGGASSESFSTYYGVAQEIVNFPNEIISKTDIEHIFKKLEDDSRYTGFSNRALIGKISEKVEEALQTIKLK